MLYYISQEGESKDFKRFYSALAEALPNYREDIMTLAQQLKQEGLQQGLQQGRHEEALTIARNMLADGMSPKAVQRLTGLPENEVIDLVKKH